ncbi:14021_t:CDS:1 [Dentiscutata erythropus]|uniref:14021_t:CDS:1 n=1 Tax=Dentiscutata erythropus TaxID=1348616 RepID=A0A9N8W3S8_9GLOM|nr:14021_t:CDS:1 [Dentiscutata erythropus]
MTISLCIIAYLSDISTAYKFDHRIELVPRDNFTNHIEKRNSGDITFYSAGLGACGKRNKNSDKICALSRDLFGSSPGGNSNKNKNCGRKLKITCGKKSVTVTVVDLCEGCSTEDVDLSPSAFDELAKPSVGRMKCNWKFLS